MFQDRLQQWEEHLASLPPDHLIIPKGNSMTLRYYHDTVLPVYLNAIQQKRLETGLDYYLQEDNDPSHGTRGPSNIAKDLKERNWIVSIVHPAQSPDLNPIEGIWNILKQRLRYEQWQTLEECKEVLQRLWSEISQSEIRKRINEMPNRCKQLAKGQTGPIRSKLW
jgi:hypothetical protein